MDEAAAIPVPTRGEEIANSISHGIGAALAVAGLVVMVVFASLGGDPWRIVALSIYGASLVVLFLTSTLYHSFRKPKVKALFRIFDHSAIYLLIAGTYTPFTLVTLRGPWGWSLFGTVWGLAVLGIVYKAMWLGRFEWISTGLYVVMGWLGVVAARPILSVLDPAGVGWLLGGGVFYTAGVIFFAWEKMPYNHLVWHLFVLAGAACHFVAILRYVLP